VFVRTFVPLCLGFLIYTHGVILGKETYVAAGRVGRNPCRCTRIFCIAQHSREKDKKVSCCRRRYLYFVWSSAWLGLRPRTSWYPGRISQVKVSP